MKRSTKLIFIERLSSLLSLLDICVITLLVFMEERYHENFQEWWQKKVLEYTFGTSLVDIGLLSLFRSIVMGLVGCSLSCIIVLPTKKSFWSFPVSLIFILVNLFFILFFPISFQLLITFFLYISNPSALFSILNR